MKTAIVIPVKNEQRQLALLVDKLREQASPEDEIIFIDAGSTDDTLQIINQAAASDARIRLINAPGAYPGHGRNIGIRTTTAEIIAQIDGGNLPEDGWLDQIRGPILRGEADYVTGNVSIMPIPKRFLGRSLDMGIIYGVTLFRRRKLRFGPNGSRDTDTRDDIPLAGGASVAYKREIWERVGGFPENIRSGEDPIFADRVKNLPVTLRFSDRAVVQWELGPTLGHILKRHYTYQLGFFRIPDGLNRIKILLAAHVLILATLLAAPFAPAVLPLPLAVILLLWLKKTAKSAGAYYRQSPRNRFQDMVALFVLPIVELLILFVRIAGTVRGLLKLARKKFTLTRGKVSQ